MATNYQQLAPSYDQRYALHRYDGITKSVLEFVGPTPCAVLEVGCGTGHWLALLATHGHRLHGIDRAASMLERAHQKVPDAHLLLASAEALPLRDGLFDRLLIVNALHHFPEPARALEEARRVLTPGGKLMIVGLQPRVTTTDWYVYRYFADTLERDLQRYPAEQTLAAWLARAGFAAPVQHVAQRFDQHVPAQSALSTGMIAKHTTSQLAELSDAAYAHGIAKIEESASRAEARGETLTLPAQLTLHATVCSTRTPAEAADA